MCDAAPETNEEILSIVNEMISHSVNATSEGVQDARSPSRMGSTATVAPNQLAGVLDGRNTNGVLTSGIK